MQQATVMDPPPPKKGVCTFIKRIDPYKIFDQSVN